MTTTKDLAAQARKLAELLKAGHITQHNADKAVPMLLAYAAALESPERVQGEAVRCNPSDYCAAQFQKLYATPPTAPAQDAQDDALTMDRMAELLTRTANALRGDPGPRRRWSWHDLPERAAAAIAAIDVMQRSAQMLATPSPQAEKQPLSPARFAEHLEGMDYTPSDRRAFITGVRFAETYHGISIKEST